LCSQEERKKEKKKERKIERKLKNGDDWRENEAYKIRSPWPFRAVLLSESAKDGEHEKCGEEVYNCARV
jgi:hypothetical protein